MGEIRLVLVVRALLTDQGFESEIDPLSVRRRVRTNIKRIERQGVVGLIDAAEGLDHEAGAFLAVEDVGPHIGEFREPTQQMHDQRGLAPTAWRKDQIVSDRAALLRDVELEGVGLAGGCLEQTHRPIAVGAFLQADSRVVERPKRRDRAVEQPQRPQQMIVPGNAVEPDDRRPLRLQGIDNAVPAEDARNLVHQVVKIFGRVGAGDHLELSVPDIRLAVVHKFDRGCEFRRSRRIADQAKIQFPLLAAHKSQFANRRGRPADLRNLNISGDRQNLSDDPAAHRFGPTAHRYNLVEFWGRDRRRDPSRALVRIDIGCRQRSGEAFGDRREIAPQIAADQEIDEAGKGARRIVALRPLDRLRSINAEPDRNLAAPFEKLAILPRPDDEEPIDEITFAVVPSLRLADLRQGLGRPVGLEGNIPLSFNPEDPNRQAELSQPENHRVAARHQHVLLF